MPSSRNTPTLSTFRTCLTSTVVSSRIHQGINIFKVTPNGKTKSGFLTLSEDKFTIYITPRRFETGRIGVMPLSRPLLRKVKSIGSHDDEHEYEAALDISSIDRIQRGQNTLRFELARKISTRISSPRKSSSEFVELDSEKCLSIIFSGEKTLDLMIADDYVNCSEVVNMFRRLLEAYLKAKTVAGNDVLLLRYIWIDVDKDRSNSINSSEFASILNRINFSMKKSDSDKMYHSFAKMIGLDRNDRRRGLSFEQCVTILHKIKRDSNWQVKPVRQIFFDRFGQYMNNGKERSKVSAETFLKKFILTKQGEDKFTLADVESLFRRLNRLEVADVASNLHLGEADADAARYIDRDRFEAYLMSIDNDIFDSSCENFDPTTMNRPLPEYWINSSHNTYLTGDQFQSRSSVEMYMNALYRGCRCLELDCFDGHRDANNIPVPLVYHGHTITSKILFSDIIDAINVFLISNPRCYPLILSLENHCTLPFQESMVSCMTSILGDDLYTPNEDTLNQPLPSPEELRGKVLIKGRRISDATEDCHRGIVYDTDYSDDDSEIEEEHKIESDNKSLSPKAHITKQSSSMAFSPELSRLTLFHGIRFSSFKEGKKKTKDCMLSIDESRARKLSKLAYREKIGWIQYNHSHLSRVYPSAKRIDSSNFSPITAWSRGCQMVALNFQTSDVPRRLNDGRFRQNGNCGYVLKPTSLRINDDHRCVSISLSIKVLSGSCLPKPKGDKKGECINPYASVSVFDISPRGGKENAVAFYTASVSKNGFNPIWIQEHPFRFNIDNPEVAMIQFSVWDRDVASSDNFIGSASIPISCVREGYRSVRLFDANNKRNGAFECACLLVEVKLKKKNQEVQMW